MRYTSDVQSNEPSEPARTDDSPHPLAGAGEPISDEEAKKNQERDLPA